MIFPSLFDERTERLLPAFFCHLFILAIPPIVYGGLILLSIWIAIPLEAILIAGIITLPLSILIQFKLTDRLKNSHVYIASALETLAIGATALVSFLAPFMLPYIAVPFMVLEILEIVSLALLLILGLIYVTQVLFVQMGKQIKAHRTRNDCLYEKTQIQSAITFFKSIDKPLDPSTAEQLLENFQAVYNKRRWIFKPQLPDTLEDLLELALYKNNHAIRSIIIELGWINPDGTLSDSSSPILSDALDNLRFERGEFEKIGKK